MGRVGRPPLAWSVVREALRAVAGGATHGEAAEIAGAQANISTAPEDRVDPENPEDRQRWEKEK